MIWPDARLGEFGGFNQKIGFARQRTIKQPEIFVSPNAGPGGQNITLQGFNYQPDSTVFVLLGDAVVATARTNLEGRFSTAFFMPITAEGAQNMRVVDASGNLATASYFTDFGFNNIQTLLKGIQPPTPNTPNPQVAALQEQIGRNQAQIQQLQQQLAQVQQSNQQVIQRLQQQLTQLQQTNQQLLQRLEQLQRSLPAQTPKR
jgi:parvulin-like peptidyl-prolyl isomerase